MPCLVHGGGRLRLRLLADYGGNLIRWSHALAQSPASALGHDAGHDGVNNGFHVQSGSDLALRYNVRRRAAPGRREGEGRQGESGRVWAGRTPGTPL